MLNTAISLEYPEGQPLRERIRQAVTAEDHATIGRIVDDLRARGFRYSATFRLVSNITGISAGDWDALLYECDYQSSRSAAQ